MRCFLLCVLWHALDIVQVSYHTDKIQVLLSRYLTGNTVVYSLPSPKLRRRLLASYISIVDFAEDLICASRIQTPPTTQPDFYILFIFPYSLPRGYTLLRNNIHLKQSATGLPSLHSSLGIFYSVVCVSRRYTSPGYFAFPTALIDSSGRTLFVSRHFHLRRQQFLSSTHSRWRLRRSQT